MNADAQPPAVEPERRATYGLWEAFGVELEYMIVDQATLDVRPIADAVLRNDADEVVSDVERGTVDWSNELVLHVIELKTAEPAPSLQSLERHFQHEVVEINRRLGPRGARLMPTAMHPWMSPDREMRLWPHDCGPVYEAFHRIFDCRGHGWANLQSVHLNLPFRGDRQFGDLHAAVRLVLPLLPALAASSPVVERERTGWADNRMEAYRLNARRIPRVSGEVVPEACYTPEEYRRQILRPLYADVAPFDPGGVLQHEWLNARGAIARFERSTIEIRVLDVQECPAADLAICRACTRVLQALVEGRWSSRESQQNMPTEQLAEWFRRIVRAADQSVIDDPAWLACFGLPATPLAAGELWQRLCEQTQPAGGEDPVLSQILAHGPLARRIERALEHDACPLAEVYRRLCDCLAEGRLFLP
jgi:gamma-glutamyl:cysteine ligase YbdK (ATP-grasp superfamily)